MHTCARGKFCWSSVVCHLSIGTKSSGLDISASEQSVSMHKQTVKTTKTCSCSLWIAWHSSQALEIVTFLLVTPINHTYSCPCAFFPCSQTGQALAGKGRQLEYSSSTIVQLCTVLMNGVLNTKATLHYVHAQHKIGFHFMLQQFLFSQHPPPPNMLVRVVY